MSGDFKNRGEYPHLVLAAEAREAMKDEPVLLPCGLIYVPPDPRLSKREQIAAMVLQGLVSGASHEILLKRTDSTFVEPAVRIADAMLEELEKKP